MELLFRELIKVLQAQLFVVIRPPFIHQLRYWSLIQSSPFDINRFADIPAVENSLWCFYTV